MLIPPFIAAAYGEIATLVVVNELVWKSMTDDAVSVRALKIKHLC